MVTAGLVLEWWPENRIKKSLLMVQSLVFEWSAKSCDFTI